MLRHRPGKPAGREAPPLRHPSLARRQGTRHRPGSSRPCGYRPLARLGGLGLVLRIRIGCAGRGGQLPCAHESRRKLRGPDDRQPRGQTQGRRRGIGAGASTLQDCEKATPWQPAIPDKPPVLRGDADRTRERVIDAVLANSKKNMTAQDYQQYELATRLAATGTPVVCVLIHGGSIALRTLLDDCDAIVGKSHRHTFF